MGDLDVGGVTTDPTEPGTDLLAFVSIAIGFNRGSLSRGAGLGVDAGVSSTIECLPVVHGGIVKNSSKVSTLGLQHFQPVSVMISPCSSVHASVAPV